MLLGPIPSLLSYPHTSLDAVKETSRIWKVNWPWLEGQLPCKHSIQGRDCCAHLRDRTVSRLGNSPKVLCTQDSYSRFSMSPAVHPTDTIAHDKPKPTIHEAERQGKGSMLLSPDRCCRHSLSLTQSISLVSLQTHLPEPSQGRT